MPLDRDAAQFLALITKGDRSGSYELAKRYLERRGVGEFYERVVCPALREIGELWATDQITVADEHLATSTASAAVASLYQHFHWPSARGARVFVACPQGEHHAFGARLLADLLALDGWDEVYFGADVPVDALKQKVQELAPQVVALSVTLVPHLAIAREATQQVRAACATTRVLLGGRAVLQAPERALTVEADAVAHSAAEAVEVLRAWR
jgi:methanogenic corrinoid protein MtbC1